MQARAALPATNKAIGALWDGWQYKSQPIRIAVYGFTRKMVSEKGAYNGLAAETLLRLILVVDQYGAGGFERGRLFFAVGGRGHACLRRKSVC